MSIEALSEQEHPITVLSGYQLRDALELVAPDMTDEQLEQKVCIQHGPARTHDDGTEPEGLYCWLDEYPEEGSFSLEPPHQPAKQEPAREWVGLTEDEFKSIRNRLSRQEGWDGDGWDLAIKDAIESKLREKNTGQPVKEK